MPPRRRSTSTHSNSAGAPSPSPSSPATTHATPVAAAAAAAAAVAASARKANTPSAPPSPASVAASPATAPASPRAPGSTRSNPAAASPPPRNRRGSQRATAAAGGATNGSNGRPPVAAAPTESAAHRHPRGPGPLTPPLDIPFPTYPDGAHYNWSQTDDQVIVTTRVLPNVLRSDVTLAFDVANDTLSVKIGGERRCRLRGRLFERVRPPPQQDNADREAGREPPVVFSLEDLPQIVPEAANPYRVLLLRIPKQARGTPWPLLFRGGINSQLDMDPHSLYLFASSLHDTTVIMESRSGSGTLAGSRRSGSTAAPPPSQAVTMMEEAGRAGSVAAQMKLAAWYELGHLEPNTGIPVAKDAGVSLAWHTRAAVAGNSEACYIVMSAHAAGTHGCETSYRAAMEWAQKCIEAGHGGDVMAAEQRELFVAVAFRAGLMATEGGHGLGDPDPVAAARFWEMSARLGHAQSCWNLGIFYINGFGMPVDVRRGVELIRTGVAAVPDLGMPPQLEGLNDADLDALVDFADELEHDGEQ
ncbi:hypothetical protein HK405_012170, partial [Cladochytrium tenue]